MKNYSALLLDLDGTLLDIEVSFFLGPMVDEMHRCFVDVLDKERFRSALFGGTEAIMVEPRPPGDTNLDGFNSTFSSMTGMEVGEVDDRFRAFYEGVFPTLSRYGRPIDGARAFVMEAARHGYALCLATNPIFPTAAVLERLRWSGLDPGVFHFIPGLETMSTCKPRPEYFLDLASRLGLEPSRCLMVGNDMEQDLPASLAGMGTFLVEGHVISRGRTEIEPDARGSLKDLARMLGWGSD